MFGGGTITSAGSAPGAWEVALDLERMLGKTFFGTIWRRDVLSPVQREILALVGRPGMRDDDIARVQQVIVDTGAFDESRYFDVFAEYAKAAPEDILISLTIANRGPESAVLHVLPTLWYRNTWAW